MRYLLSLLPSNNRENPPAVPAEDPADRRCDALLDLVPADGNRPYDMRAVVEELVDDGEFLEIHERWANNLICALARLDGQVVGTMKQNHNIFAPKCFVDLSHDTQGLLPRPLAITAFVLLLAIEGRQA